MIGRGPDAALSLTGDDVSRRHAQITWHADHAIVEDLGSRNGIAVDGLPVRARRLEIGDRVQIGVGTILVVARGACGEDAYPRWVASIRGVRCTMVS